jgi:Protein of unknown function (DUF4231)
VGNPDTPFVDSNQGADVKAHVTVVSVILRRIEVRYQSEENWYLLNRLVPLLEHFDRLASNNGKRYHVFELALITTSSLTAFLVGAEALTSDPFSSLFKAAALLAALLVTAFTSALHVFNYLNKSIAYRNLKEKLVAEFFALDAGLGRYGSLTHEQKLARFEETSEALIAGMDSNWTALQSPPQSGAPSA